MLVLILLVFANMNDPKYNFTLYSLVCCVGVVGNEGLGMLDGRL